MKREFFNHEELPFCFLAKHNRTMIETASRLHGVHEYYFSQKLREIAEMRAKGHQVINLGIGSPDLPPSAETISALCAHAQAHNTHAYQSYQGIPALRQAMAEWYLDKFGVKANPANQILPLIGSKEGIMHVSMTFLETNDVALIPNPGYPTYAACTRIAGADVQLYDLTETHHWLPNLDTLATTDLRRVKIMWVNYPHMPTGANADEGFFRALIEFGKVHNILIINDNPYSFVLPVGKPKSLLATDCAFDTAMELNSLSKSHNMAGWRVGMLIGHEHYISEVLRFKSNMDSGMFMPLQMAAIEALKADETWYEQLNQTYRRRRKAATALLEQLGCVPSQKQSGMFVWARVPDHYRDAYELSDEILLVANVFITPGGIFGSNGNRYLRISLCATESVFEEAMERTLSLTGLNI